MEKLFFETAEFIRYYGSISIHNDYFTNQPYSIFSIKTKTYNIYFEESSFNAKLSISSEEVIEGKYIAFNINLTKGIKKTFSIIGVEINDRGDSCDTVLNVNMLDSILLKISTILNEMEKEDILKNKFIEEFEKTLYHALHTDYISTGVKSFVPKKVFSTNENILDWLSKRPLELSWIPYGEIQEYSFNELDEVVTILYNCDAFKNYDKHMRESFKYELAIINDNSKLKITSKKLGLIGTFKKFFK